MSEKQEIFNLMGGLVRFYRGIYNPTADALWLAACAPDKCKTALDVGAGTGGVALSMWAHNKNMSICGIDISDEMLSACQRNIELNQADIELLNADIMTWRTNRTFDLVVSNPPYFKGTPAKHNAHHNVDLYKWTRKCIARVRPRGWFCTIVDASALGTVVGAVFETCGNIEIWPLFGANPNIAERVLVRARNGVRTGTQLYRGFPMNYAPVLRNGLTIADILGTVG